MDTEQGNHEVRVAHGFEHGKVHPATLSEFAHLYRDAEWKFSFKKSTIKDPETGEDVKRPPITLTVPVPTFDGVVKALEEDSATESRKVTNFLLDLIEDAIKDRVREQLTGEKPVMAQDQLNLAELTLTYIANLPKAERTGGGISKETWGEWEADYIAVMSPIRGEEKATKAAKLFTARLTPVRSDKKVLEFLRGQLNVWASKSENNEEFLDVFTYLDSKCSELMNRDSEALLSAL
jgi:hypothetical protein